MLTFVYFLVELLKNVIVFIIFRYILFRITTKLNVFINFAICVSLNIYLLAVFLIISSYSKILYLLAQQTHWTCHSDSRSSECIKRPTNSNNSYAGDDSSSSNSNNNNCDCCNRVQNWVTGNSFFSALLLLLYFVLLPILCNAVQCCCLYRWLFVVRIF